MNQDFLQKAQYINKLKKQGYRAPAIAFFTGLPVNLIRAYVFPYRQRSNPNCKDLQIHTVLKIRYQYKVMLQCEYSTRYICKELSVWHGVRESEIRDIINY